MCSRHSEMGADSIQALREACERCKGRGWHIGGDAMQTCPACHGAEECGECGRFSPAEATQLLDDGRTKWRRCLPCAQRDAEAVA